MERDARIRDAVSEIKFNPLAIKAMKTINSFYLSGRLTADARYFEGKNGLINDSRHADIRKLNDDFKKHPKRTMPYDSCKTIIAKMYLKDGKIDKFTYVPVWIDDDTFVPEILTHENPRFKEVIDYVTEITENQKIEPKFAIEGDEVRIVTE